MGLSPCVDEPTSSSLSCHSTPSIDCQFSYSCWRRRKRRKRLPSSLSTTLPSSCSIFSMSGILLKSTLLLCIICIVCVMTSSVSDTDSLVENEGDHEDSLTSHDVVDHHHRLRHSSNDGSGGDLHNFHNNFHNYHSSSHEDDHVGQRQRPQYSEYSSSRSSYHQQHNHFDSTNSHNSHRNPPYSSSVTSSSNMDYHLRLRESSSPLFDYTTPRNVTTAAGKTVFLPCRVRHLGDRTISWLRKSDLHVLTVGKFTYTSDERFKAVHLDNTDDWALQIRFSTQRDANEYICQVSGPGRQKQNLVVTLNVVLSSARILEGPVVYLTSGSPLQLTCVISDAPGSPDYIFWHYNGEAISLDSYRIRVQTDRTSNSAQQPTSKLIIDKAHPTDSGNYSCVVTPADFAEAAHVAVHVLPNGGHTAAIQHGKRSTDFGSVVSSSSSSSESASSSSSSSLSTASYTSLSISLLFPLFISHFSSSPSGWLWSPSYSSFVILMSSALPSSLRRKGTWHHVWLSLTKSSSPTVRHLMLTSISIFFLYSALLVRYFPSYRIFRIFRVIFS